MSSQYLGKDYLSPAQVAILKALYGEEMSREELLSFLEMTDGRRPDPRGYEDAVLVVGTRGGKTDLAAVVATYESVRWGPVISEMMIPGQLATVMVIAQNQRAARQARGYIEGNLQTLEDRGHPVLARTVGQERAITGVVIKLSWPVEIAIYTASKASTRGLTGLCLVADEIAWWESAEGSYNQDVEVMRSARSRFATLSRLRPKKILISSPNDEQGVLWEEFKHRGTGKTLVVQAPTWVLNPSIEQEFFDREQEKDAEAFVRDYGAQFSRGAGGNIFLPPETVDQCVDFGRLQNAPKAGVEYVAWMDAAFRRDRFSFGIGHAEEGDGVVRAVVDHTRHWTPVHRKGKKSRPLDEGEIISEIVSDLRAYGCDRICGDQFADVPLKNRFADVGIMFVEQPATKPEKFDAMKNLRAALRSRLVSLPDDPIVVKDLKGLVARKTSPGHYVVEAPRRVGCYDDAATVVSRMVMHMLPMAGNVDLSSMNDAARPSGECSGLDYRRDESEFPGDIMSAVY